MIEINGLISDDNHHQVAHLLLLLLCSTFCFTLHCSTMSQKSFSLSNYADLLHDNEKEYGSIRGAKRDKLLNDLIKSIVTDPLYNFEGSREELKQVSLGFPCWNPMISYTWT